MSQAAVAAAPVEPSRRWPWYLLLFVLSWLVAGIVMLPLSIIRPLLHLPADVQVDQLSGTIWHGSAVIKVRDHAKPLPPITVRGGLLPLSLLSLKPALSLNAKSTGIDLTGRLALADDKPAGPGKSAPAWPVLAVSDLSGQISALSPWVGQYVPFALGGRFTLKSQRLLIDRNGPWAGKLSLNWQDATLDTTETLELGQFQANATLRQGVVNGQVHSVPSAVEPLKLKLDITGGLQRGQGLKVSGRLGPGEGASETLREQLRLLGRPGPDGMIAIDQVLRP